MTAQHKNILQFLSELDRQMVTHEPVDLYLIGGAAITLAYDHSNSTSDLDLIEPPIFLSEMGSQNSALAKEHKVYISSLAAINFSAPRDWKSKCRPVDLHLKHIRLFIPCVEDIVLGKMARLERKDFEDIVGLRDNGVLLANKLLLRLKQNKHELKELGYRNNAVLLFKEVFNLKLHFRKGEIVAE